MTTLPAPTFNIPAFHIASIAHALDMIGDILDIATIRDHASDLKKLASEVKELETFVGALLASDETPDDDDLEFGI